jgi:chromosome segregation ATPase
MMDGTYLDEHGNKFTLKNDRWIVALCRRLECQRDGLHAYSAELLELCGTLRKERDALVKALEECKEDSIELLGERDWWKDEPRSDYKKRYEETLNNIARADAALAAVKSNQLK